MLKKLSQKQTCLKQLLNSPVYRIAYVNSSRSGQAMFSILLKPIPLSCAFETTKKKRHIFLLSSGKTCVQDRLLHPRMVSLIVKVKGNVSFNSFLCFTSSVGSQKLV